VWPGKTCCGRHAAVVPTGGVTCEAYTLYRLHRFAVLLYPGMGLVCSKVCWTHTALGGVCTLCSGQIR